MTYNIKQEEGQLPPPPPPPGSSASVAAAPPPLPPLAASLYASSELIVPVGRPAAAGDATRRLPVPAGRRWRCRSEGGWDGKPSGTDGLACGWRTRSEESGRLWQRLTSSCRVVATSAGTVALRCRKAWVAQRAASCRDAGSFCSITAAKSRSSTDHWRGSSNVGGGSPTIACSVAFIDLPRRGGWRSAISMIVIPSDQMSALASYPPVADAATCANCSNHRRPDVSYEYFCALVGGATVTIDSRLRWGR
eukprot:COSAG06_NODE_5483_length_3450_cov_3.380782_3_plen_250_part_00